MKNKRTSNQLKVDEVEYTKYSFKNSERIYYIIKGLSILSIFSYVFYQSFIPVLLFSPAIILYLKHSKNEIIKKRLTNLKMQFKDAILSISSSLLIGYSVENAVRESVQEMKLLYGAEADITKELEQMVYKLEVNQTIEHILYNFARRSGIEEIYNFADVFQIAKRSGEELSNIIRSTANQISERIQTEEDIKILMAEKAYEQKVMNVVPIGIILYMNMTSPEFLSVMYTSMIGRAVMTGCILLYAVSYMLSKKITRIEV